VCEIHEVTPAERKLSDILLQHHERQRLQDVGIKATGFRTIFTKHFALMKTASEDKAYRAANMTANKQL
jgi:hypothetical protein